MLADEEEAQMLAGSIPTTIYLRLQAEYMRTRSTRVTVTEEPLGVFVSLFAQVDDVSLSSAKRAL